MNEKIFSGRYKLLETIGNGGMATVYKAEDLALKRLVAIKVMNPELSHDQEFIQRFTWEARATGSLSHRNIVSIYDAGNDNQTYYMVMEYVNGITLKELIHQKGMIPVNEAISIAMQICDALAHAHQNEIIHRDIKPQNIMCSTDGQYQITDFGISRFTRGASNLTKTGNVMGSVHYFSPEQAQGQQIDFTSDLYSLGVVLYEMITGHPPYDAPEHIAVALMHIQKDVPNPKDSNPNLPDELCELIKKAMSKQPSDRFQSAQEMKEALESLHSNPSQPKFEQNNQNKPIKTDAPISNPIRIKTTKKRPKILWGIATLVSVLLISLLGYSYAEATFFKKEPTIETQQPKKVQIDPPPVSHNEKIVAIEKKATEPNKKKPQKKKETKSQKDEKKQTGNILVVVGSFEQKENAESLANQMKQHGFEAKIIESFVFSKNMYRVQSGKFKSRTQAEEHLNKIKQSGILGTENAFIVDSEIKKN